MKRNKIRFILVFVLVFIELLLVFLTYKSFSNKKIEQVKETNEVDKKAFSMFINDGNDNYTEYTSSNLFPEGYVINLDKSSCIDNKGQILEGILSGTDTSVTVKSTTTAYCYLYFDQKENGKIELSETDGTIYEGETTTFTITNNLSGGTLSVTSKDTGIATATINEAVVTIKGIKEGTTIITVTSSETDNYFSSSVEYVIIVDKKMTVVDTLIANAGDDLWQSTLEDDGYRYIGTDPSNYICFGTTDKDTCTGNTDLYMYRIIGIFEDSSGNKHLKLIKKEALNTAYAWHSDSSTDTDWDASDLYNGINGSYFLTNTTYSYMQDSIWTNKIETWDYTATNTLTYESSGMNYYSSVISQTYLHEMNRSTKTSTIGEWKTVSSKIGLMYASDYNLSLGSSALNYTNSSKYSTLETGWMHLNNNDSASLSTTASAPPTAFEWTMSRYGAYSNGRYNAWRVFSYGYVNYTYVGSTDSVRPVFYLTSDVTISGEGTSTNPYIIS